LVRNMACRNLWPSWSYPAPAQIPKRNMRTETLKLEGVPGVADQRFVSRVASCLVGRQKWGPEVCKCWSCGFSPVRQETTLDEGRKLFCYICPNEDCETYWQSPKRDAWQPSKQQAAEKWNAANVIFRPRDCRLADGAVGSTI
jgi:hypothetical protein